MTLAMVAGVLTMLVAIIGALRESSRVRDTLAQDSRAFDDRPNASGVCGPQLRARSQTVHELEDQLAFGRQRRKLLTAALVDPGSPHFASARVELEREEKFAERVTAQRKSLQIGIQPGSQTIAFTLAAVVSVLLSVLVRGSASQVATWRPEFGPPYRKWWQWWIFCILLMMGSILVGQYLSSASVEKTWFGYDSYCISSSAFWFVKLALFGNQMIVACVVALLGCLSSRALVPRIMLEQPRAGVGDYVDFVQRWVFRGLVAPLAFGCYWMWLAFSNAQRTFTEKVAYSIPQIAAATLIGILLWRFTRNMQDLRRAYSAELSKNLAPEQRGPEDPTQPFFHETPWKVPSMVAGLGAIAWTILELLGVRESLFGP